MNSDYYLNFENRFRGERHNIIEKLSIYNSLVDISINNNTYSKFLDIGCGRGEWLEKWNHRVSECFGIEINQSMINYCRNLGLKVLDGDAKDILRGLPDNSVTLITIFHMIEHLKSNTLFDLLDQCYRVLHKNGLLIMETPNIDNIRVSTNLFYTDHTHINHINPEGLGFMIEQIGFHKVKHYYINGGPLENAHPIKLTRILNGVSQDLLFIATKTENFSNIIFDENKHWENKIGKSLTTLEAAIDYDLQLERTLNELEQIKNIYSQELPQLSNSVRQLLIDVDLLKAQFKYVIYILEFFKKLLMPIVKSYRLFKKIIRYSANKIFLVFTKYQFTREILKSKFFINSLNFFFNKILSNPIKLNVSHIKNKINKPSSLNSESIRFNRKLILHYKASMRAKEYKKSILKSIREKLK